MNRDHNKDYQVDGKQLRSPHIDVTFKPTNGQTVTIRFNGATGESAWANDLRIGEWVTLHIERSV